MKRVIAAGAVALLVLLGAPSARAETFNTTGDHSHTLGAGPYKPLPWKTANTATFYLHG